MADKNKGRLGGLLGQRDEEPNGHAQPGPGTSESPAQPDTVLAYEEDWYRSLKALAERQAELETLQEEEEEEPEEEGRAEVVEVVEAAPGTAPAEALIAPEAAAFAQEPAPEALASQAPAAEIAERLAEEPAPEAPIAAGPAAAARAGTPSLSSTDVDERRRALAELTEKGLSEADTELVGALLLDPDRDIRRLALEALIGRADRVEDTAIRQALQDPTDEVREAAVRLAAARGSRDLADLLPFVAARRWPLSQQTALEVLPSIVGSSGGLSNDAEVTLLHAVTQMESAPLDNERRAFAELARAVGTGRLIEALSSPDNRRLGAVRLLLEEGSAAVLRALAPNVSDPIEEIRNAASVASELVAEMDRAAATARHAAEEEGLTAVEQTPEAEQGAEAEMITALARALQDPEQTVRDRARTALTEVNRSVILEWVRGAFASGDMALATVAAGVAELLGLSEVAGPILDRGAGAPADMRGPFVGALTSFRMDPERLVATLASVDPERKPEAVRLIWQVGGQALLPHLRAAAEDPSGPVRMAVLEVFGESGDPAAADVAKGVLEGDSSPAVRATALQVIGRGGADQRLASLSQALQDPDPDVRATALEVLPEGMGRDAAQLLLQALVDLDERVWRAAVRHLATFPEQDLPIVWSALRQCQPAQREPLVAALERQSPDNLARLALDHLHSPDPEERVLSIELAGRAGTQSCVEATIQSMQDPAAPVRRAATESLALMRSPAAVTALGKALGDPDPEIRMGSVRALGVIDDEAVLGFLVSALKDPDVRVRQVASEVLTQWSSPAVAKRLAGVLSVPNLREAAAELLVKMGPSAVELLIDVLLQADASVVPTVGQLLQKIVGLDGFMERLGSMDPDQRLRASEAVGTISGPAAVDALMRTLSDPDERIRLRSVELMARIGDPRALEAIKRVFLGDPVPEVVAAAEEAVARLGPES